MKKGLRPIPSRRKFSSQIIEQVINETISQIDDPQLKVLFNNCFPNTLDTTIDHYSVTNGVPDTFVITGDIEAMWQRDSTNQVFPYIKFAKQDPALQSLILGVIYRQRNNTLLDAYPNAYTFNATSKSDWVTDSTTKINSTGQPVNGMIPGIWERKFELDSMGNVLRLAYHYYNQTKDGSFLNTEWLNMLQAILKVINEQTLGTADETIPAYTFSRDTDQATDTTIKGRGSPARKCGLIQSLFRPSDDATLLPFNIPGNAFLSVYLNRTAEMLEEYEKKADPVYNLMATQLAEECKTLSKSIQDAIYAEGIMFDKNGNKIFAYEVDGYGSKYFMDDANVPSLLSLPYFGFLDVNDPIYQNTRNAILSVNTNPYYYKGSAGEGVGGPHVGYGYVWPMAIMMRALTSTDDNEIISCLVTLQQASMGFNFMHETFQMNNATDYSRIWFAWANSMFGELILEILEQRPHILSDNVSRRIPLKKD